MTKTRSAEIAGPFVPSGTVFVAELSEPLDARLLERASPFSASVRDDLQAPDGTVVVRRGALLRGWARSEERDGRLVVSLEPSSLVLLEGEQWTAARVVAPAGRASLVAGEPVVFVLTRPFVPPGSSYR